jgi:hypothetical protein
MTSKLLPNMFGPDLNSTTIIVKKKRVPQSERALFKRVMIAPRIVLSVSRGPCDVQGVPGPASPHDAQEPEDPFRDTATLCERLRARTPAWDSQAAEMRLRKEQARHSACYMKFGSLLYGPGLYFAYIYTIYYVYCK